MRLFVLAISLLAFSSAASSYDIYTDTKVFKLPAVHEAMTGLAEACLSSNADGHTPPQDCWPYGALARAFELKPSSFSELQRNIRWPDDPTRQGRSFTYPKLGLSLKKGCVAQVLASSALDQAGLLCSSHYGRLQFMHAMRSIGDQSDADTRRRILAWARFTYEVASGDTNLLATDLCSAIANRDGLADAMAFADPSRCQQRRRGWRTYPPFTVRSFFTLRCSNPFSSRKCWEQVDNQSGQQVAILAAKGALLHLIQDSYSQAHTSRSTGAPIDERGGFEAKVVCRLPGAFFDYSHQDSDDHGRADLPPARDSSCNDGAVVDPVTASAAALWFIQNHESADEFLLYFQQRVIGS